MGSEKNISGTMDLSRTDLSIAVCAQEVPCGKAAESLGVSIAADTYEPSVRAVMSRLTLGEVDLGVVYATDVISEPKLFQYGQIVRNAHVLTTTGLPLLPRAKIYHSTYLREPLKRCLLNMDF